MADIDEEKKINEKQITKNETKEKLNEKPVAPNGIP